MRTTLYLIRHAATPANLMHPAKLQGRRTDPELAPIGLRQATMTRDFLAVRSIEAIYSSPLRRALHTAQIVAEPHNLKPQIVPNLTECDVGRWEGKSWEEVKAIEPEAYRNHHHDSALHGYPEGENFAQVYARAACAISEILEHHAGQSIAIVSHHVVNRTYLAGVLGLAPGQARVVSLENCGISIVTHEKSKTKLHTLNAVFHLQGVAA